MEGCQVTWDVERVPYEAANQVSSFIKPRGAHIDGSRDGRARGAHILTALLGRGADIRCYTRHPDGYLVQFGHATDRLEGRLAEEPPAGREAGRDDGR
jgi:hypothetical protein